MTEFCYIKAILLGFTVTLFHSNLDEKETSNKQKVTSNKQNVPSNEQKVTSNKLKVTSNEYKVTSNEQKVTSNEQWARSNKQQAKSNEQKSPPPLKYGRYYCAHAKRICKDFEIKNLGKYHDLYVQSNTILLADVFENFRNKAWKIWAWSCWFFFLY